MSGNQEAELCPMKSGEIFHMSAQICAVALRIIADYTSNQCHPKRHTKAKGFHLDANWRKCLFLCCLYTLTFFFFFTWKKKREKIILVIKSSCQQYCSQLLFISSIKKQDLLDNEIRYIYVSLPHGRTNPEETRSVRATYLYPCLFLCISLSLPLFSSVYRVIFMSRL